MDGSGAVPLVYNLNRCLSVSQVSIECPWSIYSTVIALTFSVPFRTTHAVLSAGTRWVPASVPGSLTQRSCCWELALVTLSMFCYMTVMLLSTTVPSLYWDLPSCLSSGLHSWFVGEGIQPSALDIIRSFLSVLALFFKPMTHWQTWATCPLEGPHSAFAWSYPHGFVKLVPPEPLANSRAGLFSLNAADAVWRLSLLWALSCAL